MITAMPCDLFVVRHGVTDWNEVGRVLGRTDVELNACGQAEAKAVAEALREIPLRAVITSPQRRAQQTAEAIARRHGLPVCAEPGLAEVWVGKWQGKTWYELQGDPDLERYLEDAAFTCDSIESASVVQERTVAAAERLRAEVGQGSALLVSHGDPIKLLLTHYLAMDLAAYRRLVINTGTISVLRFGLHPGTRLLALNWKPPGTLSQMLV
jgi:broad specificity phosphatase PhoE